MVIQAFSTFLEPHLGLIAKKDFVKNHERSVRMMATLTDREAMKKRIQMKSRIRAIQGGFAFIPHRFWGAVLSNGLNRASCCCTSFWSWSPMRMVYPIMEILPSAEY
jgi:hypothetical protein